MPILLAREDLPPRDTDLVTPAGSLLPGKVTHSQVLGSGAILSAAPLTWSWPHLHTQPLPMSTGLRSLNHCPPPPPQRRPFPLRAPVLPGAVFRASFSLPCGPSSLPEASYVSVSLPFSGLVHLLLMAP